MVSGVYLITNLINGHMYVGGSVDIMRRFRQHKLGVDADIHPIDNAIKKYGVDNFSFQIITELPPDWKIIGEHEKYWIKFYNTFKDPKHYNLTKGGEGKNGYIPSPETCKKMSESLKGHDCSPETRRKISEAHKGKKRDDETKQKISETLKGLYTGKNNHNWKDYPRIVKKGKKKGEQIYCIMCDGEKIKESFYLHKLYNWWGETHPNELLFLEV